MVKTLEGQLSITRPSYGDDREFIEISVVDVLSGSEFIEVKVKLDEFARALTGLGRVDCVFEHKPALVGMTREWKTELVPFTAYGTRRDDESAIAQALRPFERDGWEGRVDDLFNGHRRSGDGMQRVGFERYVETKEPQT